MNAPAPDVKRRIRRLFFWPILAVFFAWVAWACVRFEFDRRRLYRAIPMSATFVSEHRNLAGRWASLPDDALVRSLAQFIGVPGQSADSVLGDPDLTWLIQRVARRDSLTAYVPAMEGMGPPAWVFSTWVGSYSLVLRTELGLGLLAPFKPITLPGGRKAWRLKRPVTRNGWVLSMAFADGVLVGSISPDPYAVRYLVNRIEQRAAPLPELWQWLKRDESGAGREFSAAADRGWMQWHDATGRSDPRWVRFALTKGGPACTEALAWSNLEILSAAAVPPPSLSTGAWAQLGGFLSDVPSAVLTAPLPTAREWIKAGGEPYMQTIGDLLVRDLPTNAPIVACLCTTNYAGRLYGIRAPTLLFAVPMPSTNGHEWVDAAFDQINKAHGMSLMADTLAGEGKPLVIDQPASASFRKLAPGERPALFAVGPWLVFSSSADALMKMAALVPGEGVRLSCPLLSHGTAGMPAGSAVLTVDLKAVRDPLIKALAVYDLLHYGESASKRPAGRSAMDAVMVWLQAVEPLKSVRISATAAEGEVELRFRLGEGALP